MSKNYIKFKKEKVMNNKEKRLFNISCYVEKLLYKTQEVKSFSKQIGFNILYLETNTSSLDWRFLEPFTSYSRKNNINFKIYNSITEESFVIKIWI